MGRSTTELSKAKYPNHVWSYDLVSDQTACGRRIRSLTVIDEDTRYGLAIYTSRSITSGHIKGVLSELFETASFVMVAWTGGCFVQSRKQDGLSMPGSTNTILNGHTEPSLE